MTKDVLALPPPKRGTIPAGGASGPWPNGDKATIMVDPGH